jgi:membrane protein implicated in regulation of membrane protease activity
MCHIFLSLPIIALPLFFFFPLETALPIYLIILLVSGFLYYKLGAAMRAKLKTGKEGMIGIEAVVIEDFNPEGKITIWSEIWSATADKKKFHKGQKVEVHGFQGLTAIVGDFSGREFSRNEGGHTCLRF